jgi:hypothetical protein
LADIYVSCSRLDHDRVKPIVDRLGSLGYSVWWDKPARAGEASINEIENQLDGAKAVLTVWSANALNSTLVYAESARALDAGKLAQARLDAIGAPAPFHATAIADLSGARSEWGPLEDTLSRIVRDAAETCEPLAGAAPAPAVAGAPRLVTFATAAALAAYGVAASAAYEGALTPDQLQLTLTGVLIVGALCTALSAFRLVAVSRAGG